MQSTILLISIGILVLLFLFSSYSEEGFVRAKVSLAQQQKDAAAYRALGANGTAINSSTTQEIAIQCHVETQV